MKKTQLNKGMNRRVMYVECKGESAWARIGWVTFSKTGKTIYYRDKTLQKGKGVTGNFFDAETGDEYWVSGVKRKGSNTHPHEPVHVVIDDDALEEYEEIRRQ
jgi:hypothetical protein